MQRVITADAVLDFTFPPATNRELEFFIIANSKEERLVRRIGKKFSEPGKSKKTGEPPHIRVFIKEEHEVLKRLTV